MEKEEGITSADIIIPGSMILIVYAAIARIAGLQGTILIACLPTAKPSNIKKMRWNT
jgi:hypothetical protein